MKKKECAKVISQECIASGIYSMWIETEAALEAVAGQFISVYCHDASKLLPRPISICQIDKENKRLRIVYRVVGGGTKEMSAYKAGETVEIIGPLGNGFIKRPDKRAVLIGGGIGIPPMVQLADELKMMRFFADSRDKESDSEIHSGKFETDSEICSVKDETDSGAESTQNTGSGNFAVQIAAGYRDELFLTDELKKYGKLFIATEDGSEGTKGTVIDAMNEQNIEGDVIYACGPMPMLRAVKEYAKEHGMECQVSLEERMACGIGACLACVCMTKEKDEHSNVNNKRICKDGPVFDAYEIEF